MLTLDSSSPGARISTTPGVTAWHAAVFSQIFMVLFYLMLGGWYYVVSASPRSISEYLPPETPADSTTIVSSLVFALVWLALLYFTWKGKRVGLLAGTVWGVINLVLVIVGFISGALTAPNFSDFLFFPVVIAGTIVSAMARKSNRWRVREVAKA